jgi:glyoxylase-like metal-dependent hydrolase (beta-lactamase superfamily II)
MASVDILVEGHLGDDDHVASTVGLVRAGEILVVVDPGLVPGRRAILDPLAAAGHGAEDVTDVVFSHHHPDHTLNAALFPNARFHDHWAIYRDDVWTSRDAEGFVLGEGVTLIRTPGHTPEDISTVVETDEGLAVFTHAWWTASGPTEDPYAPDMAVLHASRGRILALGPRTIVPGHGAPFEPNDQTPR